MSTCLFRVKRAGWFVVHICTGCGYVKGSRSIYSGKLILIMMVQLILGLLVVCAGHQGTGGCDVAQGAHCIFNGVVKACACPVGCSFALQLFRLKGNGDGDGTSAATETVILKYATHFLHSTITSETTLGTA